MPRKLPPLDHAAQSVHRIAMEHWDKTPQHERPNLLRNLRDSLTGYINSLRFNQIRHHRNYITDVCSAEQYLYRAKAARQLLAELSPSV